MFLALLECRQWFCLEKGSEFLVAGISNSIPCLVRAPVHKFIQRTNRCQQYISAGRRSYLPSHFGCLKATRFCGVWYKQRKLQALFCAPRSWLHSSLHPGVHTLHFLPEAWEEVLSAAPRMCSVIHQCPSVPWMCMRVVIEQWCSLLVYFNAKFLICLSTPWFSRPSSERVLERKVWIGRTVSKLPPNCWYDWYMSTLLSAR